MTSLFSTMATTVSAPAAVSSKQPPRVSLSPSKKRAADSPEPSMNSAAAKKALSSLKAPKYKGATQSQYVRFKAHLLKDAKARGDKDTTDNITKVAKEAWKKVQHITTSESTCEDLQRYLRLKGDMLEEEKEDYAKFDAEAKAYCAAFVSCASSHLQWCIIEATEENQQPLKEACSLVNAKYIGNLFTGRRVDESPVIQALKQARDQLAEFKAASEERALLTTLQNATEEELKQHVKEHIRLLAQAAELDRLKKNKAIEDERQLQADERELEKADGIQDEITRALKKQMKYGNLTNKHSSTKISYTKGGVSQKVFAKAFSVPVGTKKATIDGDKVGETYLRYGASLKCTEVNVKLVGDELVAHTSFYMHK